MEKCEQDFGNGKCRGNGPECDGCKPSAATAGYGLWPHEAAKKECPFTYSTPRYTSTMRSCSGPVCMAWRWMDSDRGYCGVGGRHDTTTLKQRGGD